MFSFSMRAFAWLCVLGGTHGFSVASRTLFPTALGPTARNGLTYEDVEIGSGRRVNAGDTILCYYEGSFLQLGKGPLAQPKKVVFDATEPEEPVEFLVGKGQLISGMDKGICGDVALEIPPMNIGGDRKLSIPSALAYGEMGAGGGAIPPSQDLMFQIAVLNAEKKGGVSASTQLVGYAGVAVFGLVIVGFGWFVLHSF